MKDDADRDLAIAGPGLAAEAIRARLVDRYLLRLVPTIVGGGTSALPDAARSTSLSTRHVVSTTAPSCSTTASEEREAEIWIVACAVMPCPTGRGLWLPR